MATLFSDPTQKVQVKYPCGCVTGLAPTGQFHVKHCRGGGPFGLCWAGFELTPGDWLDLPIMKGLYHRG